MAGSQLVQTVLDTPTVRLSYPALFTAREQTDESGKVTLKYGATLHFDERSKQDTNYAALMAALAAEVNLHAKTRWPDEFKDAVLPFLDDSSLKSPWLDPKSPKYRHKPEYNGVTRFIRPSSQRRIPCVGRDRTPIDDPELLYPGCYVRCKLVVFTYANKGNHGPGFGLRALQYVGPGERLDGGIDASEAFEALDPMEDTPFDEVTDSSASNAAALAAMFA